MKPCTLIGGVFHFLYLRIVWHYTRTLWQMHLNKTFRKFSIRTFFLLGQLVCSPGSKSKDLLPVLLVFPLFTKACLLVEGEVSSICCKSTYQHLFCWLVTINFGKCSFTIYFLVFFRSALRVVIVENSHCTRHTAGGQRLSGISEIPP